MRQFRRGNNPKIGELNKWDPNIKTADIKRNGYRKLPKYILTYEINDECNHVRNHKMQNAQCAIKLSPTKPHVLDTKNLPRM